MKKHQLLATSILASIAASLPAWGEVQFTAHRPDHESAGVMEIIHAHQIAELATLRPAALLGQIPSGDRAQQETTGMSLQGPNSRRINFGTQFPMLTRQSQLIASLHGPEFNNGATTAMRLIHIQPEQSAQLPIHFNAVNALFASSIGKSTPRNCPEESVGNLRQAYLANQLPNFRINRLNSSHVPGIDELPRTGTALSDRYLLGPNRLRIEVDPKILRSVSGFTSITPRDMSAPAQPANSFDAKSLRVSLGSTKLGSELHLKFGGLSDTLGQASYRHVSSSPSPRFSLSIENVKPRLDLSTGAPSKYRNLASPSFQLDGNSPQFTSLGQTYPSGSYLSTEVMPEYRTTASVPTLGTQSSKPVFDPNCLQSRLRYGSLNLSSQLSPYLSLQTSSRYFGTTGARGLQSSYLVPQSLLPSTQPTLPTLSRPVFTEIQIGDITTPATEYRYERNLVLFVKPSLIRFQTE